MKFLPRFLEILEIGEAKERRLRSAMRADKSALRQVRVLDEYVANEKRWQVSYEANNQQSTAQESIVMKEERLVAPVITALKAVKEMRHGIADSRLQS
ncbi:MAG: hypothetical protein M3458_07745, partial [Acidobacteriota bacterium]|nr:hypothetical protein [Acidobacteriota bacterium]